MFIKIPSFVLDYKLRKEGVLINIYILIYVIFISKNKSIRYI